MINISLRFVFIISGIHPRSKAARMNASPERAKRAEEITPTLSSDFRTRIALGISRSLLHVSVILAVAVFITPVFVFAHGFGQTLEKTAGDFVIDVDYDALELRAGEPIRFNFNIWNKDRTETSEFTDVWVRIAPQEPGIVFAGDLHNPEFGAAGFSYAFPTSGSYELVVRFQKNGKSLHDEVSFSFVILEGTTQSVFGNWRNAVVGMVAGVVVGLMLAFFFKRRSA